MTPGNPAQQYPLNIDDPAVAAFIRESARMLNLRGLLDRDEAIGTAHGEVFEHYTETLGSERCEKLCLLLENLANAYEWPDTHDCERDGFDEDRQECAACRSEASQREAERIARIRPEPDDGLTDCPF